MKKTLCILYGLFFCASLFAQDEDYYQINKNSPFHTVVNEDAKDKSLPYAFDDEKEDGVETNLNKSPLFLNNPENIDTEVIYDPETKSYYLMKKIGDTWYRRPKALSFEEYLQYDLKQSKQNYWFRRARDERQQYQYRLFSGESFKKENLIDKVFGDTGITFSAQGVAELSMGITTSVIDNPAIPEDNRKHTSFFMDQEFQVSLSGGIGDKLQLDLNYDTEATFDFDTRTKLGYDGHEDDIIQKIEAGNISMPLANGLIRGGQNLFGLKTEMQFGKLHVTSLFSQQKSEIKSIDLEGGATEREFWVNASNYDENRHFFLSNYFRDRYEEAMKTSPIINSRVNIQRVEVWITNTNASYENEDLRNLVAFVDLGESAAHISNPVFTQSASGELPSNTLNTLYDQMNTTYANARDINKVTATLNGIPNFQAGTDYVKLETARKLIPNSEYIFNPKLGYISLTRPLRNNEVVAVAYEYLIDGEAKQVGEFSGGGPEAPNTLYLKMLKSTSTSPNLPTWNLMMKNVYSIGARGLTARDFVLDIVYNDDKSGSLPLNYIPEEGVLLDAQGDKRALLEVFNLDELNSQLDRQSDGMFDYIEGMTILPERGMIVFPVLEPFGKYLREQIGDDAVADQYVFEEIYTKTQAQILQHSGRDKFAIQGTFEGDSGGDISLESFNVPQGAVKVYAGTRLLQEGTDYVVDYTTGSVKVINESVLGSSTPIRIETENNSLFDLRTRTLIGTHLDYRFSEDFNLGATLMYQEEKALYSKVGIGEEPVSNMMWGLNGAYRRESGFLTNLINKLPFYSTTEQATIEIEGEFAQLLPGHNKAIGKSGTSYIDDFEGSKQLIDLRTPRSWTIASTPGQQPNLFPEADDFNSLTYGYNRANLSWYRIDPFFHNSGSPISVEDRSNHYVREVREDELFPGIDLPTGAPTVIRMLDMHYDPTQRGQYNFDVEGEPGISRGLNEDGSLKAPETRWGGVMREMFVSDFEAANVQYVEFWIMDPFIYNQNNSGNLYINLGEVSEDILKDSRKSFENGLPTAENDYKVDTTQWGNVPSIQSVVNAFDNNAIDQQDLGLDGLDNEREGVFFKNYLDRIGNTPSLGTGSQAYQNALIDPANDDYRYFRDEFYDAMGADVIARYAKYNHLEGNSKADNSASSYSSAYSNLPDVEDINRDNTLNETESYFQYKIPLSPSGMQIGRNYVADKRTTTVTLANGATESVDWYQFKIPITSFQDKFGNIDDFRAIRFMRVFLKDFRAPVTLRFPRFYLVKDDWRTYEYSLEEANEGGIITSTNTKLDVSAVNLVENSLKQPVNYIMPPGIDRVVDPSDPDHRELNEQGLLLKVTNLEDGDARAVFKKMRLDIRRYKRLIMDVHAEAVNGSLNDDDVNIFLRLGSDFSDNYYEYEIPLSLTPPGIYNAENDLDRRTVWPDNNRFDFDLSLLKELKLKRNREQREGGKINYGDKYSLTVGELEGIMSGDHVDDLISIKGNPNLMNIHSVMIGIRNPKKPIDDGLSKTVEVWTNELRLSDFESESGWAANLRMTTNLSDLGAVSMSGSMVTSGFGSIEESLNQRTQEDIAQYDIVATMELGRLLPERWRMSIPTYYSFSEYNETPKYSELDPDIELDRALENAIDETERGQIESASRTYVKRESLNFTNVKLTPHEEKEVKPWSASNFSATYAQSETYERSPTKTMDLERDYRGLLEYNYVGSPKKVEPFKNSRFLSTPSYKLLKDFNFYYFPSRVSIRSDVSRHYREIVRRNVQNQQFLVKPTYDKDFLWNRYYDLDFPLTDKLSLNFSAVNMSRIDEPDGIVDKRRNQDSYTLWKSVVWDNFRQGGRNVNYNHRFNLEYELPIEKIPYLDWVKATAGYGAEYWWDAGPITVDTINVGNSIRNLSELRLAGTFDLVKLYNKSTYLAKINQTNNGRGRAQSRGKTSRKTYEENLPLLKANKSKLITHNLETSTVSIRVYNEKGELIRCKTRIVNENRVRITANEALENARIRVVGTVSEKQEFMSKFGEVALRALMSVRDIKFEYNELNSSSLYGFLPTTNYFGLSSENTAPGWGFVLGNQDENYVQKAALNNYLTTDNIVNEPYLLTRQERFSLRSTVEPFKTLQISLNAERNYFDNSSQYYSFDDNGIFTPGHKISSGNLSMSYLSLKSSFFKIGGGSSDYTSESYTDFLAARRRASERLAQKYYGDSYQNELRADGYYNGYGSTSQQVLTEAFHEAYGGKNRDLVPSLKTILPNWRVRFSGLAKLDYLKNVFKRVDIEHAYSSTYNVGDFQTSLAYSTNADSLNLRGDLFPSVEASTIAIDERFNPLIGVKMEWHNNLSTDFRINRSHLLQLNMGSAMLTESASNELVLDLGYRFDNFDLFLGRKARQKKFENTLNIIAGFSLRRDNTILRKIDEEVNQITSGQETILFKFSADYALSERFNLRAFYDRSAKNPYVSNTFPTIISNMGLSVRFNFTDFEKSYNPFENRRDRR